MIPTQFYINGLEHRPVNADSIGFKLDFTSAWQEAELNVDNVVLANEARDAVMLHMATLGPFEGIPYTIKIGDTILEYYIDLADSARFTDVDVEVKIKRRKAVDWFKPLADGLSFEAVNARIGITGQFNVPYIIVKDDQVTLLIMLSITAYTMTKELITAAKELQEAIADLIAATTPDAPPAVKIGDIIALSIKVAAQAIYVALLIVALINLITEIINLLVPITRNFKAMTFRQLITRGLQHPEINLGFSSSLTQLDATFLPVPLIKEKQSIFDFLMSSLTSAFTKGYPTAADGQFATLGGTIDFVCNWLNVEYRILDGVLYIEDESFFSQQSGAIIRTTLNIQDRRTNAWTYNFGETWKRAYMHYAFDASDTHTLDNINGVATEYETVPITTVNADLVTIKGLNERAWPVALGSRKAKLNFVEKRLYSLAQLADGVVNFLGGNSSLAAKVLARIGNLQISSQFYTVPKLLWCVGGKQPANYLNYIGADAIYDARHVQDQVEENFQRIEQGVVPLAPGQFDQILNNRYAQDQFGNEIKILTFEWINESREANLSYSLDADVSTNTETQWIN